jgi:Cu(I)/Ag(I) efflux system membrane fusion protein
MAIVRWALVALMAVAATASVLYYFGVFEKISFASKKSAIQYYCPMHPSVVQDHPGECPICSMTLVPRETGASDQQHPTPGASPMRATPPSPSAGHGDQQGAPDDPYYCPMHPEVTSKDPNAKCPKCGMKLEPKPSGPAGAMGSMPGMGDSGNATAGMAAMAAPNSDMTVPGVVPVDLTQERIQLMGMRTARVTRENLVPDLRTVGVVTPNEKGLSQIHTRFTGWIEQLLVSQTGQHVKKGQVLATIYSPDLLTAQQEFLNALRWSTEKRPAESEAHHVVTNLAEDARRRLQLLGIASEEIDELARTGKTVRALPLRSPVTGYVTKKAVVEGISVDPNAELFQVADLSTVWIVADVYEYEISRVKIGQRAELHLASYQGKTWSGRLDFLYPTLDSSTRTMRVRFAFPNPGLLLKPGMYADVVLKLAGEEGLTMPEEALVDTGEVQYVFLAKPGGRFEPRKVKTGTRSGEKVQILEGLDEGDIVVTTANFFIDSESHLRAAVEGLGATGQPELPKGEPSTMGAGARAPMVSSADCDERIDKQSFPDKYRECLQCEKVHRGMGTMEDDCKNAIAKPWK